MAESLLAYGPYDTSAASYGVNYYPRAASFFPNEAQAVQDTPINSAAGIPYSKPNIFTGTTIGNIVNNFLGSSPQDTAGLSTDSQNYATSSLASSSSTPSGIVAGIESYVGTGALRVGVVVLGFILVASGLTMFKNGELKISVTK